MSKVLSFQQFMESKQTNVKEARLTKEGRYYIIECDGKVEKIDTRDLDESDDNSIAERVVNHLRELKVTKVIVEGIGSGSVMSTMKTLLRNDETVTPMQWIMGKSTSHQGD